MISEQEIKDWWERKIPNYLQNYERRNRLTISQAKEKLFTETHEKFVESVPRFLKNFLDEKARSNKGPRATGETDLMWMNKLVRVV